MDPKIHWETIYKTKAPTEVSWFEAHHGKSLELISRTGVGKEANIIDVGGGASTLADDLLNLGFTHITVLDVSSQALKVSKERLGARAQKVIWLEEDITEAILPENHFDVWHDRVLFHFLTSPKARKKYVYQLCRSLKSGGHLIIATFGINGPARCSGLDIIRYSPQTLNAEFGNEFTLVESFHEKHPTPFDTIQEFLYCRFVKR